MIPSEILRQAEAIVSEHNGKHVTFSEVRTAGGGSINEAFCLESKEGKYFLKWNDAASYPGMFEAEKSGLDLLRSAGAIQIPVVIATSVAGPGSFLLMEWIEPGIRKKSFWSDFGKSLARLHRVTAEKFGLGNDNYIGSLPQSNSRHTSWTDFFIRERIEPQMKRAVDSGKTNGPISQLANLYKRLPEIIPDEKPSLIHGDLWNGNFLVAADGAACLIDPAVYYGHREMDLAMSRLFGGFDSEFYRGYQEEFPLEKGFDSRIDIHNLYPLLVHVNLFGGGYVQQVESILRMF
jgi:protein-ribulosamine 3-kinase